MYLNHFGLRELPFGITPDTAFAFSARSHQEALNTLLVALASGEGFIKITGEVGTGKTLLCRRFLATLGPQHVTAYVPNPYRDSHALLAAVADELSVKVPAKADARGLLKALDRSLLAFAASDRTVVLCLDEAQALPLECLEALRLLSNLETEKRKLMHLVLFGQPELDAKLGDPSVRQLRQRIAFSYRLSGLGRDELAQYVAHRLRVAGHHDGPLFEPAALRLLHRASEGVPRLVNILAHKAMLCAYGEGARSVSRRQLVAALRDSEDSIAARRPWWRWTAAGRALLGAGSWRS